MLRFRALFYSPLALLVAAATLAQSPGAVFTPMGDFEVIVAGRLDSEAMVYESRQMAAVLVVSDALPSPIVLHAKSMRLQAVPRDRLSSGPAGLEIVRGEALADLEDFQVEGTDVVFKHGTVVGKLRPRAPLVGDHPLEDLLEHSPQYRVTAAAYKPDPVILAKLREIEGEYRVRVVFGSWCSVCKIYLPRGIRVEEELGSDSIRFEYFGLPLEEPWEHAEVKRIGVKSLPTAVVYRGDREVGRYEGAEGWQRPEARLLQAINASQ